MCQLCSFPCIGGFVREQANQGNSGASGIIGPDVQRARINSTGFPYQESIRNEILTGRKHVTINRKDRLY